MPESSDTPQNAPAVGPPSEPLFEFAVTTRKKDVKTLNALGGSFAEMVEWLTAPAEVGEKDGDALIPAVFRPCPSPCRNAHKPGALDCGGGTDHRLAANVVRMTMLGCDLDNLTQAEHDAIIERLDAGAWNCIIWQTHGHGEAGKGCRLRVLFPFLQPLELKNPKQWSRVVWPMLMKFVGLPIDMSTSDPCRVYFLPRKPTAESVRAACAKSDGAFFDWRLVPGIEAAMAVMSTAVDVAPAPAPDEDPTRPVDLEAIRARLSKISDHTAPQLKLLLKGLALVPPPSKRGASDISRREGWRRTTVAVANVAEGWESTEALLELFRDSHAAEMAESPEDHTEWDTIVNLLESARDNAPQYKAEKRSAEMAWHESFKARLVQQIASNGTAQPAPAAVEAASEVIVTEAPGAAHVTVPIASRPLSDLGNAERFADQHASALRYVAEWGNWARWDGTRWAKDLTMPMEKAKATVRSILVEALNARDPEISKRLAAHSLKSESASSLNALLNVVKGLDGMHISATAFDGDPWALNVLNGTIDLRTGLLRPHRQNDLFTKLASVHYDPAALCPTWDRFLQRIMCGKPELLDFLQRCVGYSLTADVSEQVMIFLHGGGQNGKSTFLTTLQHVFGEYAKQAAPSLFLSTDNEVHPAGQADLQGSRLVISIEVEKGRTFAEVTIKQLTGGDRIKARFMRQDFFEFKPTFKIMIAANHKPRVRGTDKGIWRRIRLVPFLAAISETEKDPQLPKKLEAEAPGILAWAVRGCLAWQRDGLKAPEQVTEATQGYRTEQDRIGEFIEECCVLDEQGFAASSDLYLAYQRWCNQNGDKPWSGRALGEAMSERGFEPHRTARARGFLGLTMKPINIGRVQAPMPAVMKEQKPDEPLKE